MTNEEHDVFFTSFLSFFHFQGAFIIFFIISNALLLHFSTLQRFIFFKNSFKVFNNYLMSNLTHGYGSAEHLPPSPHHMQSFRHSFFLVGQVCSCRPLLILGAYTHSYHPGGYNTQIRGGPWDQAFSNHLLHGRIVC
jgi:hypothetical protein